MGVGIRESGRDRQLPGGLIGLGCLTCGTQYDADGLLRPLRQIVPFDWSAATPARTEELQLPLAA